MKSKMTLTMVLLLLVQASYSFELDTAVVDQSLSGLIKNKQLVGVSALVKHKGKEIYFGAFGDADREAKKSMQRDTLVQIFSMTKPVTGVALMTLYDQGKLDLQAPLSQYLPEYKNLTLFKGLDEKGEFILGKPQREPTVYDVLRHTAGFASSHAGASPLVEYQNKLNPGNWQNTLRDFSKTLAKVPLMHEPGTQWLYGPSVDVQAALVETLSGEKFDDYVKKTIFKPLGMQDTFWVIPEAKKDRIAALYERAEDGSMTRKADNESLAYYSRDWPLKHGSWGLISSLDDYSLFAEMLLNDGVVSTGKNKGHRILKSKTVKLMATDALPSTVKDISWLAGKGQVGFGVDFAVRIAKPASREEASGEVGEFYWDGAANTLFWVDPENELTAVLFTQYRPFGKVPLHKVFRDAVYKQDKTASSLALYPN